MILHHRSTLTLAFFFIAFGCQNSSTNPIIPKITTSDASSVTQISAVMGGTISDDGGSAVSVRGVCWGSSLNPTIDNDKTSDGAGKGMFTSSLTNLTPGTAYHARAYAVNKIGTAYGNDISFTTAVINSPVLTTVAISVITSSSAQSGGNVSADGGSSISERGVCWSIALHPVITDSKTSDGIGTGAFVSNLTSLLPATTYYVRAYATNSAGTSYGDERSFATLTTIPQLTTTTISTITHNSAASGGTISSDGGTAVIAQGVCYSTTSSPTIANSHTADATGTEQFISSISGLTPSTMYYVRAYATNAVGTAYGNEVTFTTNANSTITLSDIKDTSIFNNATDNAANGDYGAGGSQVLQVGFSSSSSMYARTLIQFDLTSIPSSAVIESVSLQLTDATSGTSVPVISIYPLTQSWTEGSTTDACVTTSGCNILGSAIAGGGNDATWNVTDFSTSVAWGTVGGSFNSTASATSADAGASLNLFTSSGMVTDVQGWVTTSATNYGWIMKISEPTSGTGKIRRYASRNSTSTQPKLVVTYH